MKIIDYYPNLERAITYFETLTLSKSEDIVIKKLSKFIKEYIEEKLQVEINFNNINIYYLEDILSKTQYNNLSNLKKEIIIANILLPNDIEIAELLNQNGYTFEDLKSIIRFRTLLKNKILNDKPLNQEEIEKFIKYKEDITNLLSLFKNKFNIDKTTIILNRICEMLVTHPNIFESKTNFKTR